MAFIVIDNIRISSPITPTLEMQQGKQLIHFGKLQFVAVMRQIEPFDITHYATEHKNLYLQIRNEKLYVNNSLHKFYKGNNFSDFTYSEIVESINLIEELTGIEAIQFDVTKLEFGLNIQLRNEIDSFLNCIKTFKKRYSFKDMSKGSRTYGKSCELTEYLIKLYNKTFQVKAVDKLTIENNILRCELVFNKNRVIPNIETLEDLRNPIKLIGLVEQLKKYFKKISIEGEKDFTNTKKEDRAYYFAGLNSDYWEVEKTMNKDKGKSKKKSFDRLYNEITKVNYHDELMNSIEEKFNQLLGS